MSDRELRRLIQVARDPEIAALSAGTEASLAELMASVTGVAIPTPRAGLRSGRVIRASGAVERETSPDRNRTRRQAVTRERVLAGVYVAGSQSAASSYPEPMERGRLIVGFERATLAKDLVQRYTNGESIRALASSTGRSYGFVHRILTESGVQLRERGGARRRKK